jgi:hypothetical protein
MTQRLLVCKRGHSRDPNDPDAELRMRHDSDRWDCVKCRRITDRERYLRQHPGSDGPERRTKSMDVYEDWLTLQPISRNEFAMRMGMTRDAVDKAISRAQQRLRDLQEEVPGSEPGPGLRGTA